MMNNTNHTPALPGQNKKIQRRRKTMKLTWTPAQKIEELRQELNQLREVDPENQIDMSSLPGCEMIPADIDASWPVWAMDNRGWCLVGDDAQGIAHIDEIREAQKK
jgi:hypothetical protein